VIRCVHPEVLLLVPLVAVLLKARLWPRAFVGALRVAVLLLLAALLAELSWVGADDGRDVVFVVDRSASMPADALGKAREFAQQVAAAQTAGDRLGVLSFGRNAVVESLPQAPFAWPETAAPVDGEASDLAGAVEAAQALVPAGRQGSLVVLSDGEHTGGDLDAAARAVVRQGLRVDTLQFARQPGRDTAVVDVTAPSSTPAGAPFAVGAVVAAAVAGPARWRLFVDGAEVRQGRTELAAGRNVLQFQPTLAGAGLHEIAVEVQREGDARPENDRATAVVRAEGPRGVLVVTPGGREDALTRALRGAQLAVSVAAPGIAPLTAPQLDAFRAVVLEDVPAGDLPAGALQALASWVEDLGGGVLLTGGRSSFGVGGYHRSPVEHVLPVTMEIREQQRRFGLAMAIALDCSGSMQADAGGSTKMALASRGAASAIEMLSPIDDVAVLSVDTRAHVVVAMQPVVAGGDQAERARGIGVGGGGIYVGEALHAAAEELHGDAPQQHKHLVLFADAADAEKPEDYETFVPALVRDGITVSVIGLGTATDKDAALLRRIAELGGGRCQFVGDANELPRVFAQETIQVARSSMVEAPTAIGVRPGLQLLGGMPSDVPEVGGYSLAWPRPRAEVALATLDDQQAPFLAHWQIGLGRGAAFLGEADGPLSGGLVAWPHYADFFATLVRWLAGGQPAGVFADAWRERGVGVWTLEVEPERAAVLDGVRGVLLAPGSPAAELVFERTQPGQLTARVPLLRPGTWRAAVQLGTESLALPPLCLPYSPEFALEVDARAGERTLRQLARATGGTFEPTVAAVVAGERRSAGAFDLGPWLATALVVLLLAEIAVRRLRILERASRAQETPAVAVAAAAPAASAPAAPEAAAARDTNAGVLGALARAKRRSERP
jgi:uncharacterized membrane protein